MLVKDSPGEYCPFKWKFSKMTFIYYICCWCSPLFDFRIYIANTIVKMGIKTTVQYANETASKWTVLGKIYEPGQVQQ